MVGFMSHLAAIREAARDGVSSLVILEDDVLFARHAASRLAALPTMLGETDHWIVYGYPPEGKIEQQPRCGFVDVPPTEGISTTHMVGFSAAVLPRLTEYLDRMLVREPGSPDGGPMHVDGAYSWFRRAHPDIRTLACTPAVARQRSSRSDIAEKRWIDSVPGLRDVVSVAREVKSRLRQS